MLVAILLVALALVPAQALVPADAVSYAILPAGATSSPYALAPFNGQWSIKMFLGKTGDETTFATPHVCNKYEYGAACNQPPLRQFNGDAVRVSFSRTNSSAVFKTLNAAPPKMLAVRLCYANVTWTDRGWRKKNKGYPMYGQDCTVVLGTLPFNASGGAVTLDLSDVEKDVFIPTAIWYAQVCVWCETPTGWNYCQCDKTEGKNTFETEGFQGRTPGITAAAIICSVFSPLFLVVFWTLDSIKYKRTGTPIKWWGF